MRVLHKPHIVISLGAFAVAVLALIAARLTGPGLAEELSAQAKVAIARVQGSPVHASFISPKGWPSRHPVLSGGEGLNEARRDKIAKAVAAVPSVGGVRWEDGTALAEAGGIALDPLHCQEDVEALLGVRTIRFEESSARIDASSRELINEVANALRPCLGSIIAITGHTDASGPPSANLALSEERALAVRRSLINRGIPAESLRATGLGSSRPIRGLDARDPANRRIEFSVISKVPIIPTPVDTPGPR